MTENVSGVIAESYAELQSLSTLREARQSRPLPPTTWDSSVRAVLQSVEVALLNLSDLLLRAASDIKRDRVDDAATKLFWARGFHRVLVRLSLCPAQLGIEATLDGHPVDRLRLADSPAFQEYLVMCRDFDDAVLGEIASGRLPADAILAEESLGSARFNVLHLARICSHESTIWAENLAELAVSAPAPAYTDFVASPILRLAVHRPALRGDTFFMQFRGLHQIPETIGEEINDRLAAAILAIREGRSRLAAEQLGSARALSEVVQSCLPPMVDNLATSDFHHIRENLGLTSGSHSLCLRYDMFTNLYQELWESIRQAMVVSSTNSAEDGRVEEALARVARLRFEDAEAGDLYLMLGHCLALRAFIFNWRAEHLHLPRNNLGGEETRSLTGSHDAVRTVTSLREAAMSRDPFKPLASRWGLSVGGGRDPAVTDSDPPDDTLDAYLLRATGHLTQDSFTDVQQRSGFFAQRCSFTPPPPRRA